MGCRFLQAANAGQADPAADPEDSSGAAVVADAVLALQAVGVDRSNHGVE